MVVTLYLLSTNIWNVGDVFLLSLQKLLRIFKNRETLNGCGHLESWRRYINKTEMSVYVLLRCLDVWYGFKNLRNHCTCMVRSLILWEYGWKQNILALFHIPSTANKNHMTLKPKIYLSRYLFTYTAQYLSCHLVSISLHRHKSLRL